MKLRTKSVNFVLLFRRVLYIKKHKNVILIFGSCILSIVLVIFYFFQINTSDNKTTTVDNLKMTHLIIQEKKDSVLIDVSLENVGLLTKEWKQLPKMKIISFQVKDNIGKNLELEPFKKGYFSSEIYAGIDSGFRTLKPKIPYKDSFVINFKLKDKEKIYEGPIEIRIFNYAFSKFFIGKIDDGMLIIEKEKVELH
jgi:hypothetical protein